MIIEWFGHACFRVTSGAFAIVLDPYADDYVPGLPPLRLDGNAVLCSHGHGDHSYAEAVTLAPNGASPFTITEIASVHDHEGGAKRGQNTIRVLEAEGLRVAHLGDLGTLLDENQIRAMGPIDALMLPIGGYYTIDAQEAQAVCGQLSPRVVFPMHYRSERFGFDVLSTLADFLALRDDAQAYSGNAFTLTKETPAQTAILTYP